MSAALMSLRARLAETAALQQFFQDHYQRDARHYIGYKQAPSAGDYPVICYVPVRSQLGLDMFDHHRVSLVVGVHEPGVTDDVFDGVARLNEAVQLIFNALYEYDDPAGSYIEGPLIVTTDLGLRHPFYETEIQFDFILRRS